MINFKKLSEVEQIETASENVTPFVSVDGEVYTAENGEVIIL